jgi:penicillin-binding protein 2B
MEINKNVNINRGAAILSIVFVLLFFVVMGRFFYIGYNKTVESVGISELAEDRWTKKQTIDASRGTFYDRVGNVIAEDIPSYSVIAILNQDYPNSVKDVEETASSLAPVIGMEVEDVTEVLSKEKFQVEFGSYGRKISHSKMKEIEALNLSGIEFIPETKRYYPNQTFASHIIGYTTENSDGIREGVMGLEKTLEEYLKEEDGFITYKSDRYGFELPESDESISKPKHGYNVHLTIDEKIQLFVEEAMEKVDKKYNPERMIAVVAEPNSGRILAMGNYPSFNPNERKIENYTNYAISTSFEPGSTMKIFTLAAAIEEGVYNGEDTYQSGSYKYNDNLRPICDHVGCDGWGTITYDEGVRRSSNVAFSKIAKEQLGFDRFYQYLLDFKFDQKTGIDLPGEVGGKLLYNWESEKLTTAFGQGTAITPIQQIQAATAIANDGKMMKPYVIEKVVNPESKEAVVDHEPEPASEKPPISEETAKQVRDILATVVTDGTGTRYQIEGYSIAGKTGTAQVPGENGKYKKGWSDYIYSFLGMAPKDDPKLVVYVAVDQPKLEFPEPGSAPTSELFKTIMKSSLQYLSIEPTKKSENSNQMTLDDSVLVDNFEDQKLQVTVDDLKKKDINIVALGSKSRIIAQAPFAGTKILPGERMILNTGGKVIMPDITGWSRMDVLKLAEVLGINPEISGAGYVTKQSISPGSEVKEDDYLIVQLEPPGTAVEPTTDDQDQESQEQEEQNQPTN